MIPVKPEIQKAWSSTFLFDVVAQDLLSIWAPMIKLIDRKHHLPIIRNLHVSVSISGEQSSDVVFTATDLTTQIEKHIITAYYNNFGEIPVIEKHSFVFDADLVFKALKKINPEKIVRFSLCKEEELLEITIMESDDDGLLQKKSVITLPYLNSNDFPMMEDAGPSTAIISMLAKPLKDVFEIAKKFTSTDELKLAMTGVCLNYKQKHLEIVATDAHRLILAELPVVASGNDATNGNDATVIIPKKAIDIMISAIGGGEGAITLYMGDKFFTLIDEDFIIKSRRIAAVFPDYRKVIPQTSSYFFNLDKNELLAKLRLLECFCLMESKLVRLDFFEINEILKMAVDSIDLKVTATNYLNWSSDKIKKTVDEEDLVCFSIGLNLLLFTEIVNSHSGNNLFIMEAESHNRCVIVKDTLTNTAFDETNITYLLMPVLLGPI